MHGQQCSRDLDWVIVKFRQKMDDEKKCEGVV